jgi:PAS domain S-box-containing protein
MSSDALVTPEITAAIQVMEPPSPGPGAPGPDEALHLRRLIEQQPACLMRAGVDGVLLAVNEAALRLLGAESLTQVLGRNLTTVIMPRQHEEWLEFAARVRDGASGSLECDLTDLSGMRRTILLQAVPLLDHADGVPSMILTARDLSAPRRLEAAIRERETSRELDDLQQELKQGFSEPPIDDGAVERTRQTLSDEHQAALLLKDQEAQQLLNTVRSELEQARAEQQRLTALLEDNEAGHARLVAAHAAERVALQKSFGEEQQFAVLLKERDGRRLLDDVRLELEEARAGQQRLTALLEDREAGHERMVAAHAAEQAALRQTLAEEQQLALLLKEREGRQLLGTMQIELEQALGDRQRLTTMLDERDLVVAQSIAKQGADERALAAAVGARATMEKMLAAAIVEQAAMEKTLAAAIVEQAETEQALVAAVGEQTGMERARVAAMVRQAEVEKALADQRVERETLEDNARNLEWLAAAGRVAVAVGNEMLTIAAAVDARTKHLLTECPLDADNRHVIEALRFDANETASLARQLLQIHSETPMTTTDSSKAGTSDGPASGDAERQR